MWVTELSSQDKTKKKKKKILIGVFMAYARKLALLSRQNLQTKKLVEKRTEKELV